MIVWFLCNAKFLTALWILHMLNWRYDVRFLIRFIVPSVNNCWCTQTKFFIVVSSVYRTFSQKDCGWSSHSMAKLSHYFLPFLANDFYPLTFAHGTFLGLACGVWYLLKHSSKTIPGWLLGLWMFVVLFFFNNLDQSYPLFYLHLCPGSFLTVLCLVNLCTQRTTMHTPKSEIPRYLEMAFWRLLGLVLANDSISDVLRQLFVFTIVCGFLKHWGHHSSGNVTWWLTIHHRCIWFVI